MKNFRLDDSYTQEDIENINALLFIASMVMLILSIVAKVVGIL